MFFRNKVFRRIGFSLHIKEGNTDTHSKASPGMGGCGPEIAKAVQELVQESSTSDRAKRAKARRSQRLSRNY